MPDDTRIGFGERIVDFIDRVVSVDESAIRARVDQLFNESAFFTRVQNFQDTFEDLGDTIEARVTSATNRFSHRKVDQQDGPPVDLTDGSVESNNDFAEGSHHHHHDFFWG